MNPLSEAINSFDLITVLGATAGGKTAFAANLAQMINAEIISADSRQVYRKMNLGTGKDYSDYLVNNEHIPYHLIDIVDPGKKYNVYQYQKDFVKVYKEIKNREKRAILCGGSGLYIESILKDYQLITVPSDDGFHHELQDKSMEELTQILASYKQLHNTSDTDDKNRLIRAVEIAEFYAKNPEKKVDLGKMNHLILGIKFDRNSRRKRISERLKQRFENGMIEEVQQLIDSGVDSETLIYYGLEYKYITMYIMGSISYDEMYSKLETAIHQFSKRQMTWFRRMEKNGTTIHWLDGYSTMNQKMERLSEILESKYQKI